MSSRYPYHIDLVEASQIAVARSADQGVLVPGILRVDVPLLRKAVRCLGQLPEAARHQEFEAAVDEAKQLAYEKFVLSLQIVAEYEPVFPIESLSRYEQTQYVILIPTAHWRALRLHVALPGRGRSLFARYERFEFEILAHPRLRENEGYLIGHEKYQLYLNVRESADEICVYRSEFLDRNTGGLPPIGLQVAHLVSELMDGQMLASRRFGPDEADSESSAISDVGHCPGCSGRLHYLTSEKAFCLDCDWDNLEVLSTP